MAYSVSGSSATALKRLSQIPFLRPAGEARMNVLPGAETHRHIAPGNAGPKLPDHSLDEEPIAQLTIAPNTSGAARQQFLNPRELIAAQSMTVHLVHREAFQRRLPMNHAFPDLRIRSAEKYSSRSSNVQHRFRLIEDTP